MNKLEIRILNIAKKMQKKSRIPGNFLIVNSQIAKQIDILEKQQQRKIKFKNILNDFNNSCNE